MDGFEERGRIWCKTGVILLLAADLFAGKGNQHRYAKNANVGRPSVKIADKRVSRGFLKICLVRGGKSIVQCCLLSMDMRGTQTWAEREGDGEIYTEIGL